jgi:hypothetical protein
MYSSRYRGDKYLSRIISVSTPIMSPTPSIVVDRAFNYRESIGSIIKRSFFSIAMGRLRKPKNVNISPFIIVPIHINNCSPSGIKCLWPVNTKETPISTFSSPTPTLSP